MTNEQLQDLKKLIKLSDQFFEEVLPQAGHLVLDIGVANDLGLLLTKMKREYDV